MSIFNLISMLGGLALFLYGMRIMGDGLKQGSSSALKKAMGMITNNPLMGFLLGLVVTAVIQSSTATVVLTAGLVGAGILTVHQSIGVIIGAHLGTTVTGQIIRLLDINGGGATWIRFFQPSTLAPLAAIIGIVLIMMFKSANLQLIGTIAMGFGILFTGLMNMTAAVEPLSQSETFANIITHYAGNPVLGYLTGLVTALFFHSSASVGILQTLSVTGALTFASIYAILIGIYMGDCLITGTMVSIGAGSNAKRVGCIHILFCLGKTVVVLAGIALLRATGMLDNFWSATMSSGDIANVNTLFNLVSAIVLLPVCGIFEKLSYRIVREKEIDVSEAQRIAEALNRNLYDSPELALSTAASVIAYISNRVSENLRRAFDAIFDYDENLIKQINRTEDDVDMLQDKVGEYLANLSTHIDSRETNRLNYFIKCVSEFERIGDLAFNLGENAAEMHEKGFVNSEGAKIELGVLRDALTDVMEHTHNAFLWQSREEAKYIEPIEEVVDDLIIITKDNHFERVKKGECSIAAGYVYLDILTNIERISDQCANVGVHTISLADPDMAESEHDYINNLHMGKDEDFNNKFRMYTEKYTSKVPVLGSTRISGVLK